MIRSESITTLLGALIKARAGFGTVTKNAKNPHFGKTYADLVSVQSAVDEALAANDLVIIQAATSTDSFVEVETILFHAPTGEHIGCNVKLTPAKNDPQGVGSAITYARRYGMLSLLNLAAEDDDGHAATNGNGQAARPATNGNGPLFNRETAINKFADMVEGREALALKVLMGKGVLKPNQRLADLPDGMLKGLLGDKREGFLKALAEAGEIEMAHAGEGVTP